MAVSQLAGHAVGFQRALTADQFTGLFGGSTGTGCLGGLFQNCLGNGGVFLKVLGQGLVDHIADQALDEGIAQLGLGLALELSLLQLDTDDGNDTLAGIGAGKILVLIFQDAFSAAVLVQHTGQGQLKAFLVGAALRRMHVIGKTEQQFIIAVIVILQSHLGHGALALALHIHDLRGQRGEVAALAQVADEGTDAALVAHGLGAELVSFALFLLWAVTLGTLICQGDADTGVQEGFFPQALEQRFVTIQRCFLEHFRVRLEGDRSTGGGCRADLFQITIGFAALEALLILGTIAADANGQPLRQCINDRRTDAVQTASHLVAGILAAELTAGVQHGIYDCDGRDAKLGLYIHGDAAAVIGNFDDITGFNRYFDMGAVPSQGFVDGVIDDLVDQVMQAGRAGRTDIHAGTLAHSLQALQDLDLRTAVGMVCGRFAVGFGDDFFCHEMIASCCGGYLLLLPSMEAILF